MLTRDEARRIAANVAKLPDAASVRSGFILSDHADGGMQCAAYAAPPIGAMAADGKRLHAGERGDFDP